MLNIRSTLFQSILVSYPMCTNYSTTQPSADFLNDLEKISLIFLRKHFLFQIFSQNISYFSFLRIYSSAHGLFFTLINLWELFKEVRRDDKHSDRTIPVGSWWIKKTALPDKSFWHVALKNTHVKYLSKEKGKPPQQIQRKVDQSDFHIRKLKGRCLKENRLIKCQQIHIVNSSSKEIKHIHSNSSSSSSNPTTYI